LSKSVLPKAGKASTRKTPAPKTSTTKTSDLKALATKAAKPKAAAKAPVPKAPASKAPASKALKAKALKPATTKPKIAKKASVAPAAVEAQSEASKTLSLILARLDDMKAEETVTIDLRGKSAFSDYMVVTSGRSNRHVGAVAENLAKGLKETGIKKIHVEGLPNCDWVLIDSGDVIVHVFRPEVREFYNLERLWSQTPTPLQVV
jgi:ribosome-associated protein